MEAVIIVFLLILFGLCGLGALFYISMVTRR